MTRKTQKPALENARAGNSALQRAFDGLVEQARRWRGDTGPVEDEVVTKGELTDSGIGKFGAGAQGGTGNAIEPPDQTERRTGPLTNLQAKGAFQNVIIDWEGTNQRHYARTEIHRATVDNIGKAVLKGTSVAPVFADSDVDSGQTYYYWVRAISTTGNPGPFNDTAGTKAEVAVNPEFLLSELTGEITESQLFKDLNDRIDLIDGSASLSGSVNARIDTEKTERVNADNALASDISTLEGNVGNNAAAIEERARVKVDGSTATAQYDVRLETTVDGQLVMGGFGLASDGSTVQAGFNVDRFWIGQPGVDYSAKAKNFPFIVGTVNGLTTVTMDKAHIGDATISNLKLEDGAVDEVKMAAESVVESKMADGSVTNAKIKTAAVDTAKLDTAAVGTLKIQGDAVTVPQIARDLNGVDLNSSVQTLISMVVDVPDVGSSVIFVNAAITISFPQNSAGNTELKLVIDGTTVFKSEDSENQRVIPLSGGLSRGQGTYTVEVRGRDNTGNTKAVRKSLYSVLAKR